MNKKSIPYVVAGLVTIAAIAISLLHSYRRPLPAARSDKIEVAASFYPLYFFAREIGGDRAVVMDMTPAGAEPHDYEPTPGDIAAIENSKLVILNGGGLEAWGDDIKKNIDPARTQVIVAGKGLTDRRVTEEGKTTTDPHVWLSPVLAGEMVERIAQGFERADPANKSYYQANAAAMKARLADLDRAYRQGLSRCAERDIITSHAAFGYLAAAYGLKQVSIAGLSPDAEPSAQQLAHITEFARKNHVKYIFFERLVSPKLAGTIAGEIGAQTLVLNPIEGLSNRELADGKDYFTEMKSNLVNLEKALQCR